MVVPFCVLNWRLLYLSERHLQRGSFPLFLGGAQSLSNSCVSFPLFVCTHREGWVQPGRSGRGGILGALTRGSYHRGRGWEPARMGAPQSPGKLVEEQRLLQELHLAPGRA